MREKAISLIKKIEEQVEEFNIPWVTKVAKRKDPYKVLVSCILSLRTKDKTTSQASQRLFSLVKSPSELLQLSLKRLQNLIYPVGFYRKKAKVLLEISKDIVQNYKGKLPSNLDGLLKLKGVGRKTANLVLGLGFGIPSICVDTHVHRITNRLGLIKTKTPLETEKALEKIIPKDYWIKLNSILVAFGQNICLPISPFCSKCRVNKFCKKIGVIKYR
ncbi:MAG: endonuclease III [Candidatus Omnitrophica bacterium]|nr:endonuclease III [Candidatus Omnitrophota bacterium]